MIPNTNFKNIMTKTQTTDFLIACKESRIENNTSFYGCFYLGPFDDSLSQTLANNIRRTLLSELTGLAITSIEIEGILHKFSSLPGMKETVLDLICNLQNIVLKKQKMSSTKITLRSTKKTYIGFLNVSGPRVIKAMDLKLPSGLQCVDPNQYIATLAEDGLLNMKFNVNEGKNFIKQKPQNLDVSVLKKRNILLQNFKKKTAFSSQKSLKYNNKDRIKLNQATTKMLGHRPNNSISLQVKTSISNPITLDAVFMPVTKINCIIEENNLYSDFSTDTNNTYNQIFDDKLQSKVIYKKNQPKTEQFKTILVLSDKTDSNSASFLTDSNSASFLNAIDYNSIYQTCLVLQKNNTKDVIKEALSLITNQRSQSASIDLVTFQPQSENHREFPKSEQQGNNQDFSLEQAKQKHYYFKLIPWQSDSLYFDINDMSRALGQQLKQKPTIPDTIDYRFWLSKKQVWFPLGKSTRQYPSFDVVLLQHTSFSKIKTFFACKASKNSQLKINQNQTIEKQPNIKKKATSKTKKKHKILFCKTISNIFKNTFKKVNSNINPIKQQTMFLEYAKTIKLKPLRKKVQLIVEIWTNGSIHPRQALYQCFTVLSNNFLKLQTVKMLGSMFKSELAYGNLKYSIRNNYNFYYADQIKKIKLDKKNRRLHPETRELKTKSFAFGKINILLDEPGNTSTRKTYLNQINFYSQATLKAPIAILKISLRAYTALKKAGILTINDLVKCSKKDLLKINNLEKKSLVLIETSLSYLGLTLKKIE